MTKRRKSLGSVRVFYPEYKKGEIIQILSGRLKELKKRLPLIRVVLFGSYAKGNYTVGSDIDLLIVYDGEPQPDAYAITKRMLDIPRLEPHLYTGKEYREMEDTMIRMLEGGIVLLDKGEEI